MPLPDTVKVLKSLHISRRQFDDGVERGEVGQNVLVVHKHIIQLSLGLKDFLCGACTHTCGEVEKELLDIARITMLKLKHAITSQFLLKASNVWRQASLIPLAWLQLSLPCS